LARAFAEAGYEAFVRAARALGGQRIEGSPQGGNAWQFELLPKIRARVVYEEADEEYPLEIKVLFDNRAIEFLEFECLAFLNGCLVEALIGESLAG
jgi:hypothetical protein